MVRAARDDWSHQDYYAILGVPETASRDEINRAYRRRARATHPDVNTGDSRAELHFDELAAAREVLSDPTARAAYDELRKPRTQHVSPIAPMVRLPLCRPSGPMIRPGPVMWRPSGKGRA